MKQFPRLFWATITLCAATTASAQVSSESLSVTLTGAPSVGIDSCAAGLAKEFTAAGTLDSVDVPTGVTYEVRLTYSTSSQPCSWTELPNCPQHKVVDDRSCGCIATGSTTSLSKATSLADTGALDCSTIEPGESDFNVFFEYEDESDEEDTTFASSPETIRIDFTRPGKPAGTPRIKAAESALEVSFDAVDGDDIDRYEVCVREVGAISPSTDAGTGLVVTNEDLRDGYDVGGKCVRTDSTFVRVEGLENGVTHSVVYAAIDDSSNRGPNSEAAEATPAGVNDFAEEYAKVGGTETGGCAAVGGAGTAGIFGLLLGLGLIRRRRIA